jgi:hypothetical protein
MATIRHCALQETQRVHLHPTPPSPHLYGWRGCQAHRHQQGLQQPTDPLLRHLQRHHRTLLLSATGRVGRTCTCRPPAALLIRCCGQCQ